MGEMKPVQNQDAIDRKAAWIERMFDRLFAAIKENPYATIAVVSVAMNIWQFNIGTNKDAAMLAQSAALNEKIIAAVEKRVQQEIPKQLAPIQAQADSNTKKLDTSLINLNGTVETVKQYFNKNKKK